MEILRDPVLVHAAAAVAGLLLALAAWPKLRDLEAFQHAMAGYEMLPQRALPLAARLIPLAELAAAALLLHGATRVAGATLALLVLLVFTFAGVHSLRAGRSRARMRLRRRAGR